MTEKESKNQNPTQDKDMPKGDAPLIDLEEDVLAEKAMEKETQKLEEAYRAEVADLKETLMRTLADAENLRKRAVREKEDTARFAIQKFAQDLLSVSDHLGHAIQSFEKDHKDHEPETKTLLEGVKLTEKELLNVFERQGLQKILPIGEKFDHNFHEAMFEIETDEHPAGTVVELVQAGYTLNGRLLRAARVGVAKEKSDKK